ncbi:MAG: cell wall hydrolase [Parabacteroides sp.]|nr:cell wall hydrolase [Parabacteroides sp.]
MISLLIGLAIGLPISCFAIEAQRGQTVENVKTVEWEITSPYEANTSSNINEVLPDNEKFTEYEMTPEDIAEEEYWDSLELLACCVMAEAEGEDLMGKRMVVDVVLNRVDDPDFPDTITGVITQKYQFSSYWDGRLEKADPTEDCFTAVKMELEERSYPGIFYFTAGQYGEYGTPWKQHGNHYFCTK